MPKVVVMTELAEQDLERITDYLVLQWGVKVCKRFLDRFEVVCEMLSRNPRCYRLISKKHNVRKCVLTSHNTIYYRERKDKIEILTIFDTRQDPHNLRVIGSGPTG